MPNKIRNKSKFGRLNASMVEVKIEVVPSSVLAYSTNHAPEPPHTPWAEMCAFIRMGRRGSRSSFENEKIPSSLAKTYIPKAQRTILVKQKGLKSKECGTT